MGRGDWERFWKQFFDRAGDAYARNWGRVLDNTYCKRWVRPRTLLVYRVQRDTHTVEVELDTRNYEQNERLFEALRARGAEIERAFGGSISFDNNASPPKEEQRYWHV